jgi:glutamate synthase domain-containing protein 1
MKADSASLYLTLGYFPIKKKKCFSVDTSRVPAQPADARRPIIRWGHDRMCGIVGLFLKDVALEPKLGSLLAGMLATMCDRGPDSAGFAVYGAQAPGCLKVTLRIAEALAPADVVSQLSNAVGAPLPYVIRDTHVVLTVPEASASELWSELDEMVGVSIVSLGRRMEIFKEVGRPDLVAERFGLPGMSGTHGIGHTRMATESAVTTDGAHPFTTGADQCLVHNGSLSNHNAIRRELVRHGLTFRTENDTEVAAGFIAWKMRNGASLDQAMAASLHALDGFYTFVVGTETGFSVLRDPIACKPAVMAETDRWVAFGTEYRTLVDLPGVESAKVWEPEPAKVYVWERQ